MKDFGCGAIGLFGFAIALLSTAQLIPQELHNRTIYTILAKPVRRSEFLLGKFFGIVLLLALCVALMTLAFAASLYWQESQSVEGTRSFYARTPGWDQSENLVAQYESEIRPWESNPDPQARAGGIASVEAAYHQKAPNWDNVKNFVGLYESDVRHIEAETRDPEIIEALVLIFAKLIMTTAIALLISTFASSSIFTIVTTFMIYLIGHMEGTAREFWLSRGAEVSVWQSGLVGLISLLIPDMNSFTIVDEILAGNPVPWAHTLSLFGYADVYIIVLLAVSCVIFDYREI